MTCDGRYAEAWQYASFWCRNTLIVGTHKGAGPADATLQDTEVDFINLGAEGGVGQVVYNVTQNTNGKVATAAVNELTVTGVTWAAADTYRSAFLSVVERSQVEHNLNITAGDIHAALGAVGACNCTFSAWGANFLAEINIMLARIFYDCPCNSSLSEEERALYSELVNDRLNKIIAMEIDPCQGATGKNYPLIGWAEVATTEQAAEIILKNDLMRNN